jgi:hypothetical protein
MVANQQAPPWNWDNTEPFGNSMPNDDADGDGVAPVFDLRFGAVFRSRQISRTTWRDYDPAVGRWS